jgi:single-strand DNA-binding protein
MSLQTELADLEVQENKKNNIMVNKVTLVGNLGRDPETKVFEDGSSVTRLTLATNESYKEKDGTWKKLTEWHTINTWGALAERSAKDFKKGTLLYVEGKIKNRTFTTSTGVEKTLSEIEALSVKMLDKKEDNFPPMPTKQDSIVQETQIDEDFLPF